jgi:competence protein ComEA
VPDDDDAMPLRPPPPVGWRDLADRLVPPERAGRVRLAVGAAALAAVAVATWWVLRPPPAPAVEQSLPFAPGADADADAGSGPAASASTATTAAPEVVVHAAGAVASPGLHRLGAGARVADLLAAAGGPAADADLDRVNLAATVADGERVWFPRVGEEAPPPVASPAGPDAGRPPASAGPVDLNGATVEELEALPGVGPTIAAAIVQHRDEHGPFRSVDDLLEVAGIGPSRLEQLRDLVSV